MTLSLKEQREREQYLEEHVYNIVTFGVSDIDEKGERGGTEYWIKMKFRVTNLDRARRVLDYIESLSVITDGQGTIMKPSGYIIRDGKQVKIEGPNDV